MTYQIHRLNFGSVVIDAAMQIRGRAPGTIVAVPAQGYLIMGGDAPVLVDAGYRDPTVLGSGGVVEDGQGFADQLALYGVQPGDLGCVIMTHLHRDHAGHLDEVPMNVPVVVNRGEMSCAFSGVQGLAYARADLAHLVDRMYTPGALHYLDLDYSGPVEVLPGISCHATGGHTAGSVSIVVDTTEGQACLCGDLIYDVEAALNAQPGVTPVAGVQPCFFGHQEPAVTNNFTVSVLQELGALKRLAKYRFVLPAHDAPGVLERGQLTGRINGATIPGHITPSAPRAKGASA
jgi:glyoxylase-like metal-dependent hydrolase (beta-lactamase superfamily II)